MKLKLCSALCDGRLAAQVDGLIFILRLAATRVAYGTAQNSDNNENKADDDHNDDDGGIEH